MRKIKITVISCIAIGLVALGVLLFMYNDPKQLDIMTNVSVYWSNEWKVLQNDKTRERSTTFSGSELDFDFTDVREFTIKGTTTNTDDDTSVMVYLDNKDMLLTVSELKKGKVLTGFSDNKRHSFRLFFYCRGYNPCNFTLTDITAKGGSILKSKESMKTLGVLGDSISLLYAQDNYTSILSRNISFHLHNASVWGRDLSHMGKRAPAVELFEKDLLAYKPDIVLISLGTNDILDSISEDDFLSDLKKIIDETNALMPNTKIVVVSILSGKTHQLETTTDQWNNDVQKLLSDNMYFVDDTYVLTPGDYLDAIHPNISGQRKLADFLTKYLVAHKLL